MPKIEESGCHGCRYADWDADGCTCKLDGLLVGNSSKGCAYRIGEEEPETVSEDYERGFKDGLKSECLEELKPFMTELIKGYTEAIKGITPMLIDNARLTIKSNKEHWIPVSERLPKKGVAVLCACRANIKCVMKWDGIDWYENPTRCYMSGFVTHWMPLPEPPKEVEEDADN